MIQQEERQEGGEVEPSSRRHWLPVEKKEGGKRSQEGRGGVG